MRNHITIRIALLTIALVTLFAPLALADGPIAPSHVLTLEIDEQGTIQPYSHYLRKRELDPKTEQELQDVVAAERRTAPEETGHIAVRASNAKGDVIYRTIAEVALMRHSHGPDGEVRERIERPVFTVIVPAEATLVVLEGWDEVWRATFDLGDLAAKYGEQFSSGGVGTQQQQPPARIPLPANRFTVLFLGDGYTAAEEQLFNNDLSAIQSAFFGIAPYNTYRPFIGTASLFQASTDSGAVHPTCAEAAATKECDPLEGVQTTRNTAYGARYCSNNIQRALVVNNATVTNTINARIEGGNPDAVVVMVNDGVSGGSRSGNVTTVAVHQPPHAPHPANTLNPWVGYVVAHEIAHTTGLSDEYDDRGIVIGPPPYCNNNCGPNVQTANFQPPPTAPPTLAQIKWARWIDTVPVPTCTDAQQYNQQGQRLPNPCNHLAATGFPVGLYEGAGYYRNDVYRSENNCLMKTLSEPPDRCAPNPVVHRSDTLNNTPPAFCRICTDTLIRKFYDEADPVEAIRERERLDPFNRTAHLLPEGATILLGADVLRKTSDPQKIMWRKNGVHQPLLDGIRLVPFTGVRGQTITMEMAVIDETTAVRDRSAAHAEGRLAKPLRMTRSLVWTMTTPVSIAADTSGTAEQTRNVEITVPQGSRTVQLRYAVNTQEPGDPNRPGDSWGIIVAYGGTAAAATTTAAPPLFSQQNVIKSSTENFERLISVPVDTTAGDTKVVITVRIRNLESEGFVDSRITAEVLSETVQSCGTLCEACERDPSIPGCPVVFRQLKAEMQPHEPDGDDQRPDLGYVSIARVGMEKLDTGRHVRIETTPLPYPIFRQMDISVFVMSPFSEELALVRRTTWKNDGSRTGGSKGMERVVQNGSVWKLNVSQKGDFFGDSLLANIPADKWPHEFKYRIRLVVTANDGRSTTSEIDVAGIATPAPPFTFPLKTLRKEDAGNNIEGIWHRWASIHAHRWFNLNRPILHRADRIADEHGSHDTPVGHERGTVFTEVPFYPGAGVWTNSAGTAILRPYWDFRKAVVDLAGNPIWVARRETVVNWINATREHLNTLIPAGGVAMVRIGDGSKGCESPLFRPNDILPDGWMRELLEYGRVTINGNVAVDVTEYVGTAQWQPTLAYNRLAWGCDYNHYYQIELDRCRIGELPGPCNSGRPPGLRVTRIRTQPASITSITAGQTATLAVEAEGEELRYRWYAGPAGDFVESRAVANGEQPTLKVAPPETQQYWVYVWGGHGSATSNQALVQVAGTGTGPCKPPTITQQPQLITYLDPETSTTLSVTATGTNLTYQWYYAATVDAPFVPINGAISREYQLASAAGRYHVRVRNSCGTVFSNSAFIVMNTSCAVPTITSKTLDRRVTLGDFVDLNVTATGKAPLSYSWTERTPDGATRFIGATATLRVYPTIDGTQYIPTIGNECKYTTGEPVTIGVCFPPQVSEHPQSKNIVRGESATLEVTATGSTPLAVTWIDGDSKTVGTGTSVTLAPQTTTTYYARVSNSCGQVTSFGAVVTVCHPPTITTPPQGANITLGQSSNLSVVAGGTGPHSYQWYAVGVAIDGATASSLDVSPTVTTTYHVVVTGACGSITSSTATINVCTPPQITRHPEAPSSINAGQQVTLSVEATGTAPLTYTLFDQNNSQVASGTSNSFTFTPAIPAGGTGRYRIRVSGGCGAPVTSNEVTITVCAPPAISQPPQSVSIISGDSTTLSVTATGSDPLSYQWYRNGTAINGASDRTLDVAPTSFTTYTVKVTNSCGEVTSAPANVTVTQRCIAPSIGTHPQPATINAGQTVPLTVTVSGSTPRTFQWYANGSAIPGADQQTYNASPAVTTTYHVVVENDCGSVTSNPATITVESCEAPVIDVHPQPDTIQSGQSKQLSVVAQNATGHQWYANGVAINGATSATYNASPLSTTTYHVVVSNSCGSVTSNPATITVGACESPSITVPPQSISITTGQAHTLRVTAAGTAPYSYQWYANGAAVSGANGSAYTVTPTATTSYFVVVTNACGSVTSPTATVAVNCAIPVINFHPQSRAIEPGQTVTLQVGATGLQPFSYQWYANGSPIGGNDSQLIVTPQSTTSYHVVVSNACGSSTSNTATITVASCLPATFTRRANNVIIAPGETTTLSVQASGTGPISYVWRDENNNIIGNGTSINVAPAVTTTYSVRISNDCGDDVDHVTVSIEDCPLPVITVHPKSFTMTEGGRSFYEVVATSSTPLSYQWYANGEAMPGVTSRALQIEPTVTTTYFVDVTNSCGTVRSNPGTVTVTPCTKPQFTTQPRNMTIVDGEAAVISAAASGTGPITYTLIDQDRNFIDSNTSGVFSVRPPVQAPYVWGYWITASNACGTIFSDGVAVTVLAACTSPSISSQPQGSTIVQGESASLSISASGSSPLSIRWFTSSGQQIGTGNSVSVSPSSTTSYYATVSNDCGEVQSSTVTVTVTVPCTPPAITAPLSNTFVPLRYGFTKTISVTATGDALRYQWYESVPVDSPFVAMPGKTSASLAVSPDEDTQYRVRVFNDCGDVTSTIWTVKMWDGIGDPPEPQI